MDLKLSVIYYCLGLHNMHVIQLLLILFVIFAVYKTFARLRKREITRAQFIFWCVVWGAIAAAALFPEWTTVVANRFGVGRGTDFLLYLSVAVLLYTSFKLTVRMQKLDRDITKVVRRDALDRTDKKE